MTMHISDAHRTAPPLFQGYTVYYHRGFANFCPGCGKSHWYVGRSSAECAFCAMALPLAPFQYEDGLLQGIFAA